MKSHLAFRSFMNFYNVSISSGESPVSLEIVAMSMLFSSMVLATWATFKRTNPAPLDSLSY